MKLIILSTALLGVLLASVLATDNVSENNQGNVGGSSHQTVSINQNKRVVNVDNNNGWLSWNTVWDYGTGYTATRILSKKTCIITRMNPAIIPDVTTLPQAIREKQKDRTKGPARKEMTYMVSSKRIVDLTPYGKSVEAMCKGIPTYGAFEVKRPSFWIYAGNCLNLNILWLVQLNFCGEAAA